MSDYLSKMGESYDKKKSEAPLEPEPIKRPLGLTLIIIGAASVGVLLLLIALFFLVSGATGTGQAGAERFVTGVVSLLTPVLLLLFAAGAWKRKGWALYLGVFIMAWEFLFALVRLLGGTFIIFDPVFMVIELVVIVYLLHPRTRSVFDSMDPARAD